MFSLKRLIALLGVAVATAPLVTGFGLTVSGSSWIVDTSGGLVFTGNVKSRRDQAVGLRSPSQ
jgi:hypothetical protein